MIENQVNKKYLKWRTNLVLKITLFHFALILVFDILAVFAPAIMAASIWQGKAIPIGVVYAFGIVFSVVFSTFYYSWRVDKEAEISGQVGKGL